MLSEIVPKRLHYMFAVLLPEFWFIEIRFSWMLMQFRSLKWCTCTLKYTQVHIQLFVIVFGLFIGAIHTIINYLWVRGKVSVTFFHKIHSHHYMLIIKINHSCSTAIAIVAIGLALKSGVALRNLTSWSLAIQILLSSLPYQHKKITYSIVPWATHVRSLVTIIPCFSPKQSTVLSKTLWCIKASNTSGRSTCFK